MTKKEKEYLKNEIERIKQVIEQVEKGELWNDIFETEETRLAFIRGVFYVSDVFDKFIND